MSEYNGHEIYDVLSAWVREISFAPQGINGKKYLLVKAMDKKELKKILTEDDEELSTTLEKAGLFDESLEAAEIVGKLLKAYGDELPEGFLTVLAKAVGMEPPEGMEKCKDGETLKKAEAGADEVKPAAEGAGSPEEDLHKILEKADPALKEAILSMEKAAKSAEEKARRAEERAEKLEKAARESHYNSLMEELKALPGDHEKLKKALMALHEANPVDTAVISGMLKAAASAVEHGGLSEAGRSMSKSVTYSTDAEAQIHAMAKQLMKKAPEMSEEEALCAVLEKTPELYDEYERQRMARES